MLDLDVPLTKSDFDKVNWQEIIETCPKKDCLAYSQSFGRKRIDASNRSDRKAESVFAFLQAITFMMLSLDDFGEPFTATHVLHNFRSHNLGDLGDRELDLLEQIADDIADDEMIARLSDLIWILKKDYKKAEEAIETYLKSASALEHPREWVECFVRIKRALVIGSQLGRNGQPHKRVIHHIESVLERMKGEDPLWLSANLIELLLHENEGDPTKYGPLTEKAALLHEANGRHEIAQKLWTMNANWHRRTRDEEGARKAQIALAESFAKQAHHRLATDKKHLSAASFLEKAIQVYREVGGCADRVKELHQLLLRYQSKIKDELQQVSIPYDVSNIARDAEQKVAGMNFNDAVLQLATITQSPEVKGLAEQVKEYANKFPMTHLLSSSLLDAKGRVIDRKPGLLTHDPEEQSMALRAEMFTEAMLHQQISVSGRIEPARKQIIRDHRVTVQSFYPVVFYNPLIPQNRELLYARGLFAGLTGDFALATHFLVPQIENTIRHVLTESGRITSKLDHRGLQEEYALNTVFENHARELNEIFGEDLVFDLRGILVEKFGSNIRNLMAHGLMSGGGFHSHAVVYLWWLILRIVCLPSFSSRTGDPGR